jgi:hypothetical protein
MSYPANTAADFWAKVQKDGPIPDHLPILGPCWEWQGRVERTTGYGIMNWSGKKVRVHRLAWLLTVGPIEGNLQVLHRCDNKICVRAPAHHFLGTNRDNMLDMWAKGRARPVTKTNGIGHRAILEPTDVLAIRDVYAQGNVTQGWLAERYGVGLTTINAIIKRRNWSHV